MTKQATIIKTEPMADMQRNFTLMSMGASVSAWSSDGDDAPSRAHIEIQGFQQDASQCFLDVSAGDNSPEVFFPNPEEIWSWRPSYNNECAYFANKRWQTLALVDLGEIMERTITMSRPTIDQIEAAFEMRSPHNVRRFLEEHLHLLSLLEETSEKVRVYFPHASLTLEVAVDPDVPDREDLIVGIVTDMPAEEAWSHLNELDENWWLSARDRANGLVCVDVEFK